MKQHGLLAIWLLAITASAVLLHAGCRPVAPVTPGDEDDTSTCQVEAGEPAVMRMQFVDGCLHESERVPMIVDVWYGPEGEDMGQVYPTLDPGEEEIAYRFDLVTCVLHNVHLQWIQAGIVVDMVWSLTVEPNPNYGGISTRVITPPGGCFEPANDDDATDPTAAFFACLCSMGDCDGSISGSVSACCIQSPDYAGCQ